MIEIYLQPIGSYSYLRIGLSPLLSQWQNWKEIVKWPVLMNINSHSELGWKIAVCTNSAATVWMQRLGNWKKFFQPTVHYLEARKHCSSISLATLRINLPGTEKQIHGKQFSVKFPCNFDNWVIGFLTAHRNSTLNGVRHPSRVLQGHCQLSTRATSCQTLFKRDPAYNISCTIGP